MLNACESKHYSSHTIKINVIPMGILSGTYSMLAWFPAACDGYPGFCTEFGYFMTWQFERGAAFLYSPGYAHVIFALKE